MSYCFIDRVDKRVLLKSESNAHLSFAFACKVYSNSSHRNWFFRFGQTELNHESIYYYWLTSQIFIDFPTEKYGIGILLSKRKLWYPPIDRL